MKSFTLLLSVSLFAALLFSGCHGKTPGITADELEGTWMVAEIKNIYRDSTETIRPPQTGIWIFSGGYYSATWIPGTEVRRSYKQPFNPTPDEMIRAYNSIVVNTGTFELTDTTLITCPVVSRVPDFSGGKGVYAVTMESDTLVLTMIEEYARNGAWANWLDSASLTLKLVKAGDPALCK